MNKRLFLPTMLRTTTKLHIGCGNVHIPRCINIDLQPTRATDIVEDCVMLASIPSGSMHTVYANAFIEHVFLNQRLQCLRSIQRVLRDDGYALLTGIPDFERIAQAYLRKEPGIISPVFDLINVYRYTHGEPEESLDWVAQLHKSLFDTPTLSGLLAKAGFASFCIFAYAYRTDAIAIGLGVIAYKHTYSVRWTRDQIRKHLGPLSPDVNLRSVKIVKTFLF